MRGAIVDLVAIARGASTQAIESIARVDPPVRFTAADAIC